MQISTNRRDNFHLIRQILNRNGNVPNFAIFLGAGCSVNSGVKTGAEMVKEWRKELYTRSRSHDDIQKWLEQQEWYGEDEEYAILFERMYDQPSQRRVYVEECLKKAHPSWGYVYLTNLLSSKIFDVVFTTNFDDLINEACYLYSPGLRPIVAAHDSTVSGMRLTSDRPKIIKLHGDFLFDNIKNTLHELETLEENTKKKLKQFAEEYGLVVIGYGGRDRSVMDTLEVLLKSEDYFKQGIYWCVRQGDPESKKLRSLLRRDRAYLVEMDGFDEFMAEIHTEASLNLPDPIANPYEVARERARIFINIPDSLKEHRIISSDVKKVLDAIEKGPKEYLPRELQGIMLRQQGDLKGAIDQLEQAFRESGGKDESIAYQLADVMAQANKAELAEFVKNSPMNVYHKTYFLLRANDNEGVLQLTEKWSELDNDVSVIIAGINRAIALKRLGRQTDLNAELDKIEKLEPHKMPGFGLALAAGMAALRKKRDEMLGLVREALKKRELTRDNLKIFPVFEDFRNDEEFKKLTEVRVQQK